MGPPNNASLLSGPVRHLERGRVIYCWWVRCPQCREAFLAPYEAAVGVREMRCACGWTGVRSLVTFAAAQQKIHTLRKGHV